MNGHGFEPAPAQPDELPSGLVTFVMTDIEGSTELFTRLGDAYLDVLATHNAVLRAAVVRHGGLEVGTEGDSLFAAFADASGAVAACLQAQQSLAATDWPPGVELRVRMGLHTGQATPVGRDYVALAVHQVARISAGAHGCQVVLSQTTADAAGERLPPGATVTGLGAFQLRGFPSPVRLYQLRHPDLQADFPPPRTMGVVAHNLPFLRATFVGRVAERASLARLLAGTGVVSVVGPGGVGKTRLAVQVAFDVLDDFADGAWLVELASVSEGSAVERAVASTFGVSEVAGRTVADLLVETLRPKALVLLLDNCEHVLDAAAGLAERLLQHCPSLVVLATSREPLDIDGEVVWRLEPLPTADPAVTAPAELAASDAVQLFSARAALADPGFVLTETNTADVARVVARLNGLPLAIELAAATLGDRTVTGILEGLSDRFALLTRGRRTASGRHHTLRAALEWSLQLLAEEERRLFVRLAAFAGSGSTHAAAHVCAGPPVGADHVPALLRHLARSSLLQIAPGTADRWSMLESLRELAALELAAVGESDALAQRHRSWFVDRVELVSDDLGRAGQEAVLGELVADHDNVRLALDTAQAAGEVNTSLRLATAMSPFWTSHGDWSEGAERLAAALALDNGDLTSRAKAHAALGGLQLLRGELAEAAACFAAAHAAATSLGDDATLARTLVGSGYVAFRNSDLATARADWEQALHHAEEAGDERVTASVLRSLAIAAGSAGDQEQAERLLDRAIEAARHAQDDQQLRLLLGSAAELELWRGHLERAASMYGQALSLASSIGDLSARPLLVAELGWVALLRGDPATAYRLGVEATELSEDLDSRRVLAHALRLTGEALARQGRSDEAAATLERALAVAVDLGAAAEVAGVRCSQASLALDGRDYGQAGDLAAEAARLSPMLHAMRRVDPDWVLGTVLLRTGRVDHAQEQFGRAVRAAERLGSPRLLANHLAGLGDARLAAGDAPDAAERHAHALHLRAQMGDRLGVAESLVGVAATAGPDHRAAAGRLLTAATQLRAAAAAVPTPDEQAVLDAAMAAIGGWADGPEQPDDEASALALAHQVVARVRGEDARGDGSWPGDG